MTDRAIAYYRTSSAANVGADKDSLARQRAAVHAYADHHGIEIAEGDEFYDPAVSGTDRVDQRPGFSDLLARLASNGVRAVLVEDPTRFARDLAVQLAGHAMLQKLSVELIPVNAPTYFTEDTPTAVLVRQVLGAIAQFEKAQLVHKLKVARDRKRAVTGWCGGRKPFPAHVVEAAQALKNEGLSLRGIAARLAKNGEKTYSAQSIKRMLNVRGA